MKVFEKFAENLKKQPDKVIWADAHGEYTGEYIDRVSGQVYAYLLGKRLTTEKVVMIRLPHGVAIPICEYGIFKAGACCVVVADWADNDRFEFFRKDSGCDFIIDAEVWKEILSTPSKPGWTEPDKHDAAYIVYTSSSTGTPKGVVHEYGDFDYIIKDLAVTEIADACTERYCFSQPFYDVMSFYHCINVIYVYNFALILPVGYEPFSAMSQSVREKYGINNINFLPAAENIKKAEKISGIRYAYTGYEPVQGIYSEKLPVINTYGMSECSTPVAYFIIDKYYDIAPVGKPSEFRPLYVLAPDNTILASGKIGEIAFINPYMRGYLNLPELTKEAFRGGLYHTGDMGMFLPDGNLLVLGRKTECIYTEKGWIVPLLIEVELKKLFPGHWLHVSAYSAETAGRICVFHTPDFKYGLKEVREALADKLPPHWLPTDAAEVSSVPRLYSGKLNYARLAEIFHTEEKKRTCGG